MSQAAQPDFSEFKLRVNIKSTIENAYRALATPAGLESWFLKKAIFADASGTVRAADEPIQENDSYTMLVHGYPDTMQIKGKVLKANGKNLFSITFSKDCPVSISIYTEQNETILELFESKLPAGDGASIKRYYCGDSKGWVFYLTNLKSILEGGLDLRNKNEDLKNVITA